MSQDKYRANFLWPADDNSVEEAGYEFANAGTEEFRQQWWNTLVERIEQRAKEKWTQQQLMESTKTSKPSTPASSRKKRG